MTLEEISTLWKGQRYHLDRMTLRDLTHAFFLCPPIRTYLVLLMLSASLIVYWGADPAPAFVAALTTIMVYPLAWYLIHRFVLHGRLLYRSSRTAALWKRIHFDHHQDPNNLRVLFGALYTTLPTIALIAIPIGQLMGDRSGAAAAFGAGILSTLFYEYFHCIQHLRYVPRNRSLRKIKRLHMMHHFHNEQGNFGITNFFWDRLAGTYYRHASERPNSETVFNLGYDDQERDRYPWVARLSKDPQQTHA